MAWTTWFPDLPQTLGSMLIVPKKTGLVSTS